MYVTADSVGAHEDVSYLRLMIHFIGNNTETTGVSYVKDANENTSTAVYFIVLQHRKKEREREGEKGYEV